MSVVVSKLAHTVYLRCLYLLYGLLIFTIRPRIVLGVVTCIHLATRSPDACAAGSCDMQTIGYRERKPEACTAVSYDKHTLGYKETRGMYSWEL